MPLALDQVAEDISEQRQHQPSTKLTVSQRVQRRTVRYEECRSRAILSTISTGLLGYSGGYALQVGGRRVIPHFIRNNYVLPLLLAVAVPAWTYDYLLNMCRNERLSRPTNRHSESDKQTETLVMR